MSLERKLQETMERNAGAVRSETDPLGRATARLRSAQRRRGTGAAIALVLLAAGSAVAFTRIQAVYDGNTVSARSGSWRKIADSPLSVRHSAKAFTIGNEVLVLGGTTAPPCPPRADCVGSTIPPHQDGAFYDLVTDGWRTIADAPVPLGEFNGTVVGRVLYLWVPGFETATGVRPAFLAYHIDGDRWEELQPPNPPAQTLRLVATSDAIVAYHSTQENGQGEDLAFDPRKGQWRALPKDPLVRSFDRAMVWTGSELVLLGIEDVPQPNSERPALYRAAAFDLRSQKWNRLPDSQIIGWGPDWFWAGGLIVNPWVGSTDGGNNTWGRSYPYGGIFDPARSRWLGLPSAPRPGSYDGPTLGGSELVATRGRVLDMRTRAWIRLDAPPSRPDEGEAATWEGDRLFVWGGYSFAKANATVLDEGWIWEAG